MFAAAKSNNALPSVSPVASIKGFDGVDTDYSFGIYSIHATPRATNSIYLFCKIQGGKYVPLYIGKAVDLRKRLVGHERLSEAIRLGATRLLVHSPGFGARVQYLEAERRLIGYYGPILNVQHKSA